MWQQFTVRIQEIDRDISKQANEDSVLETIYRSAPGIGPVGARVLAMSLRICPILRMSGNYLVLQDLLLQSTLQEDIYEKGILADRERLLFEKFLCLQRGRQLK
jgi:transposase